MKYKKVILIIFIGIIFNMLLFLGIIYGISYFNKKDIIDNVDNYNKRYYLDNYKGDLDSTLEVFPNIITGTPKYFKSYLETGLFDTDGYIILSVLYDEEEFNNEVERLKNINIYINTFKGYKVNKKILFDNKSYNNDAYITIDGFNSTYEYALLDKDNLIINYIYLSYPTLSKKEYNKYLKKDKMEYISGDNLDRYSMYNYGNRKDGWVEYTDSYR